MRNSKFCYCFVICALLFVIHPLCAQEDVLEDTPKDAPADTREDKGKISLDIKGMDIVDVLKMLSQRSGLNIVVGKNVTGRVTLFLKEVDIWDVFEIILSANDLAYEKKGEIINVMTQRDYEMLYGMRYQDKKQARLIQLKYAKVANLSAALNQMKTNIGKIVVDDSSNTLAIIDAPEKLKEMEEFVKKIDLPVQTRIFDLNYASVDKLSTKIQEVLTANIGSMNIDERTNKIIITDYPQNLDKIARIISAFDEKTLQVLIDAQIIEIKPSDKFVVGVDWDYWIRKNMRFTVSLPNTSTLNKISIGTATTSSTPSVEDYKGIIDLLRTIGDMKILSSPRIMVVNNQEAKILVGTKDAYITATTSQSGDSAVTSQSVNFVDVGIKLYVTPTINRDGFVTMKIKPEVSSSERKKIISEGKETEIPIVTTSETETTIMIKDGVTIIIGGLRKDEKYKTVTKVPFFGDIPLLGVLFRNTSDETKKTELVILLTPHIVSGAVSYTDFSEIQPKDGAVASMTEGEITLKKATSFSEKEILPQEIRDAEEYLSFIWKKISRVAGNYIGKDGIYRGKVQVAFILGCDGNLKAEPWVVSSANHNLDAIAMRSIKNASPFPAFPEELNKAEKTFRITLEYK